MKTFTDAQLQKLTTKPVWLEKVAPKMAARVFAGSEGWMIQPDKVHPEGKTIPPYCIYTLPNLDKYMEAGGTPAQVATDLYLTNASYTRRSATRYVVNVSLGEEVYGRDNLGDTDVTFTLNTVTPTGSATLNTGTNEYTLPKGTSTGRLQFDLRFSGEPASLSVDIASISFSGGPLVDNGNRSIQLTSVNTTAVGTLTIIAP